VIPVLLRRYRVAMVVLSLMLVLVRAVPMPVVMVVIWVGVKAVGLELQGVVGWIHQKSPAGISLLRMRSSSIHQATFQ
jgi:hypothetical protein